MSKCSNGAERSKGSTRSKVPKESKIPKRSNASQGIKGSKGSKGTKMSKCQNGKNAKTVKKIKRVKPVQTDKIVKKKLYKMGGTNCQNRIFNWNQTLRYGASEEKYTLGDGENIQKPTLPSGTPLYNSHRKYPPGFLSLCYVIWL